MLTCLLTLTLLTLTIANTFTCLLTHCQRDELLQTLTCLWGPMGSDSLRRGRPDGRE